MATGSELNRDYERQPYWWATAPALPNRSGRDLPDEADVVVVGGGYAGITAARELARRGTKVTVLEARTLGWGGSTRNGGIVHPGYKWGPTDLLQRYGEETGAARLVHREFTRTASRLREMQSKDYFGRRHASAENPQVLVK